MSGWHVLHGRWWAVQWSPVIFFSLGVHVQLIGRTHRSGQRYGPYVDLHLIACVISIGRNPILAGEFVDVNRE